MEQTISAPAKADIRPNQESLPESEKKFNRELLLWLFSATGSIVIYMVVALIIRRFYHPDIQALRETANHLLAKPDAANPEPMESLLFRMAVLTMIPGVVVCYMAFSKIKFLKRLLDPSMLLPVTLVGIIAFGIITYMDFAAPNPFADAAAQNRRDAETATNFQYYFTDLFLLKNITLYTFCIVPLMAAVFFLALKKYQLGKNRILRLTTYAAGYLIAAGCITAIITMNTFHYPYTNENKYDFDAVYYSMTQVYSGMPMLVNHFTNTYGLYPHFLNPLFQVTGLSVFSFSLVMSLLTGLCFALNLFFLKHFTRSQLIMFLGFFSVLFFPYLDFRLTTRADSIFSFYPIRYLAPSLLGVLMIWYMKRNSRPVYWTTFGLLAAFILWNPEMGMVTYIAWTITNIYRDFYRQDGSIATRKIAGHLLSAIVALCIVLGLYELIIYAFYGAFPDVGLLFATMFVFSKIGFGLLPMTLIHPWNIIAVILLLGFTYAGIKWYKKAITPKAVAILLASLLGLGYLTYFQGRSHNANLALSSGFALMVLTLLGDELWIKVKTHRTAAVGALFIVFLFLISFSAIELVFNGRKMMTVAFEEINKSVQLPEQQRVEGNVDFILSHSEQGEKIHVFTSRMYEGLYFGGNKRIAAFAPGCTDLFLKADVERLEQNIIDSSFKLFLEPWERMYSFWQRPFAAIAATYDFEDFGNSIVMLKKRRYRMPSQKYFRTSAQTVVYRKYSDDVKSTRRRIDDAFGIKPVALGSEWSLHILFVAQPQIFEHATLVANMSNTGGFWLENVYKSPRFRFTTNGKGYMFPMSQAGWNYCVLNVYPDHFDVFENGALVATIPLASPVHASAENLCIGNYGAFHNYLGPIAELELANGIADKSQIEQRWDEMVRDSRSTTR